MRPTKVTKVIEMPEEQFLGALEREVERLSEQVQATLQVGQSERDPASLVEEAQALLAAARRPKKRRRRPR